MPRLPRHRRAAGSLEPGQCYHVTNRGVDHGALFHSDLDRIVFLSLFAEACITFGVSCHAFCLMTTHFHLLVEDTRGMLSQMMHHLEFCYARYFNDTRPRRRRGPLFESRFRAELIDTSRYFEEAAAYVLLNPLRTSPPIVSNAEEYLWSSAAVVCGEVRSDEFATQLIHGSGGIEALLDALPLSRFKACQERRRTRFEHLATGKWLERDRVLRGRSPQEYCRLLADRVNHEPQPDEERATHSTVPPKAVVSRIEPVAARPPFTGLDLEDVLPHIVDACHRAVPASLVASSECTADLLAYALWRFTGASPERIAAASGVARARIEGVVQQMRRNRLQDQAWYRLLWTLEWGLRWRLFAAPHRT